MSALAPSTGHTHPPQHPAAHKVGTAERCKITGFETRIRAAAEIPSAGLQPSRKSLLKLTRRSRHLARETAVAAPQLKTRRLRAGGQLQPKHEATRAALASAGHSRVPMPRGQNRTSRLQTNETSRLLQLSVRARHSHHHLNLCRGGPEARAWYLRLFHQLIKSYGMRRPRQLMHSHVQTP